MNKEMWKILGSNPIGEIFFNIVGGRNTLTKIKKNSAKNRKHPTIIEHLRKLESIGFIEGEKQGRERKYKVVWDIVTAVFYDEWLCMESIKLYLNCYTEESILRYANITSFYNSIHMFSDRVRMLESTIKPLIKEGNDSKEKDDFRFFLRFVINSASYSNLLIDIKKMKKFIRRKLK